MHSIRLATLEDVRFLADVVVEATRAQGRLPDDFDEKDFRIGFAEWTTEQVASTESGSTTSVIEVDGRDVGRLRVVRTGVEIELAGIQLLPDAQSRGIGSRVIADLISEAAETQRPIVLSVESDNPRAQDLYLRLGFIETERNADEVKMAIAVPSSINLSSPRPGGGESSTGSGPGTR